MDDIKDMSDGHHTFRELYEHRYTLFIALCKALAQSKTKFIWRSKMHSDGSMLRDSFVLGINKEFGEQITYHLPMRIWEATSFAETLAYAPQYDGHNSETVLTRIKKLIADL